MSKKDLCTKRRINIAKKGRKAKYIMARPGGKTVCGKTTGTGSPRAKAARNKAIKNLKQAVKLCKAMGIHPTGKVRKGSKSRFNTCIADKLR